MRREESKLVVEGVVHSMKGSMGGVFESCQRSWKKGISKVWARQRGQVMRSVLRIAYCVFEERFISPNSKTQPSSVTASGRMPEKVQPLVLARSWGRQPSGAVFLKEKCQPQPWRPWFQNGKGQPS